MASSSTNLNMGITNDKTSLGNDLKRKNNMQSPQGCMRGRQKTVERNFHTSSSSKQLCPKNKYYSFYDEPPH